jgi:type IV secretion system protein VirD4
MMTSTAVRATQEGKMPAEPKVVVTHPGHKIPVAFERFRGFIANVLESLEWREIKTPRELLQITAIQMDQVKGHSTHDYKFNLKIKYEKADDASVVLNYELGLSTTDKKKCKNKLDKLRATVEELAYEAIRAATLLPVPDTYGDAKFADEAELRRKDFITKDAPAYRLLLAPWGDKENLTVPVPYTNMHALVCGPSGTGKSSGFFVPNLVYRLDNSVIVTEATAGDEVPELFKDTAGWRQFKGSKIYFFNPDYAKGTRINPLDKLKITPPHEFAAVADQLANLVIVNTTPPGTSRSDPIWDKSEKHLLWIMIMHVARSDDPGLAHFGAIREILRKSDKQIKMILRSSNSQIAQEEYESFLSHSSDNFRHGVFAGLLQRLNPWLSSVVQTMTATTDLDLQALRQEKFSFYISSPSRKPYLKPIASLIFNFILDIALAREKFKHNPVLLLDEFTNFGAIPQIDDALSLIRKRGLPVVLGYQNQQQLNDTYGKVIATKIISNLSTRVFFRQREDEDAEKLSDALDTKTVIETKTDDRGNTQTREVGRPLMTVRQLKTMEPTEVIITTEATNPIKTKRFDYHRCPQPNGFDTPDLVEHDLMPIERLSDATLELAAKSAKSKVKKDLDSGPLRQDIEEVVIKAKKKHDLKDIVNPPPPPADDIPPSPEPEPQPEPDPEPPPKPEPKKKTRKKKTDDYDEWDIPG